MVTAHRTISAKFKAELTSYDFLLHFLGLNTRGLFDREINVKSYLL